MTHYFSSYQSKVLKQIWVLFGLLFLLGAVKFFVDDFSPKTLNFNVLRSLVDWAFKTLIFGWIFYKNQKFLIGLIAQFLFLPIYLVMDKWEPLAQMDNLLESLVYLIFILIPIVWFVFNYLKIEKAKIATKQRLLEYGLALMLFFCIHIDMDGLYRYFQFRWINPPFIDDVFYIMMGGLASMKFVFGLVGFLYLSNRILEQKSVSNAIDEHYIDNKFFKIGFFISYILALFSVINMIGHFGSVNYDLDELTIFGLLNFLADIAILVLSSRFLGDLLQMRGYSLKRYFGIFNIFVLTPFTALITYFNLFFAKEPYAVVKKRKYIHLVLFFGFISAFALIKYLTNGFWIDLMLIPISIVSVLLVIKKIKYVFPVAVVVALLYLYIDIQAYTQYSSIDSFIKERWATELIFYIPTFVALYYSTYYIIHKSFSYKKAESTL